MTENDPAAIVPGGAPFDNDLFGIGITLASRVARDVEARDAIGALALRRGAVAEEEEMTIGAITGMKLDAVDQTIGDREQCFDLIRGRLVAHAQDFRWTLFFAALLNHQERIGAWLRYDEHRRPPLNIRKCLFNCVGQGWIGRTEDMGGSP